MLKCRNQEASFSNGIPHNISEKKFIPSLTIDMGDKSYKVSGTPFVCMAKEDCSGNSDRLLANSAGLFASIINKAVEVKACQITSWSGLSKFLNSVSSSDFRLLLWSARGEIDKSIVYKVMNVAHAFNATLGTIRNAVTINKPFTSLFQLDRKILIEGGKFPLLLVFCKSDVPLFTSYQQYDGDLSRMTDVMTFLEEFVKSSPCLRIIEQAKIEHTSALKVAKKTVRRLSSAELKSMTVVKLREIARDIFGGDLDTVDEGNDGLSRADLLGLGSVEGSSRAAVEKENIVNSMLKSLAHDDMTCEMK